MYLNEGDSDDRIELNKFKRVTKMNSFPECALGVCAENTLGKDVAEAYLDLTRVRMD